MDAPWIGLRLVDYLFAAAVLVLLISAALVWRRNLRTALVRYFTEPGDALNLAVFRIAVCAAFWIGTVDLGGLYGYPKLPKGLQFPPDGLGWLVPHLPLGVSAVHTGYRIFLASLLLTAFGVFTRWAAALLAVSGAYVFLIPGLYGYVNHSEAFLIWFAILLAASPSGDALSVDALRVAWFSPERAIAHRQRSSAYSLPLRFAWLMMGLIYLFPGIHKYASAGLRWASSTNLARRVYTQSYITSGWPVAHHLDHHPFLLTLGGLMTLAFEMSFLLLILFRRTRYLAAVGGIVFHNTTKVLLHISFLALQLMYVTFVPWQRIASWAGGRIFKSRLLLHFDPADTAAARLAGLASVLDVFRSVEIVPEPGAGFVLTADEQRWHGPAARRRLIRRLPFLALFVPALRLSRPVRAPKGFAQAIASAGDASAASLEALRPPEMMAGGGASASVGGGDPGEPVSSGSAVTRRTGRKRDRRIFPLVLVASCVTAAVFSAGLASARSAWPFAMYPTFAGYVRPTFPTLGATAVRCNHSTFTIDVRKAAQQHMQNYRYAGLVRHLIGPMPSQERRAKLSAFVQALLDPAMLAQSKVAKVEFTRDELRVTPPPMASTPVSRTKLAEIPVRSCS